jgi:hypothetical protein
MPDYRGPLDPDAPPSPEELEQAEGLRAELERASVGSEGAELAQALRAAWEPRDLSSEAHRALVDRALDRGRGQRGRRWASVVRISFGRGAMIALAASVLLVLWRKAPSTPPTASPPAFAVSRSTQELFTDRFAPTGGETARIDRIALARAADLRDNEFAKWGVR